MPYVNGKLVSPDDAIKEGCCPETGQPLAGVNIEAHIHALWPHLDQNDPNHAEALRRANLLREFAKSQTAGSQQQKGA